MITVVMPYWERYRAALKTMESYDELYGDDVQVIIVDDGSPKEPAAPLMEMFERLTVITLPEKSDPKNPCVPVNRGADFVRTELIGLSNPETFHKEPSLYEMRDMIEKDNDYILAPAWSPEYTQWHCHPSLQHTEIPDGTGLHHMALMRKKLWDKTGGMDEDYRDGYCFDDTDFVMRLLAAGAEFKYSEKAVYHVRSGAKAAPPLGPKGWQINRNLYRAKWDR